MSGFRSSLLKEQQGKCVFCGMYLKDTDISTMEIDHIIPKSLGGKDAKKNLQLLHGHCHDKKTSSDGSITKGLLTKLEKQYEKAAKNRGNGIGKIHPRWAHCTLRQQIDKVFVHDEIADEVESLLMIQEPNEEESVEKQRIWRYIYRRSWEIEEIADLLMNNSNIE